MWINPPQADKTPTVRLPCPETATGSGGASHLYLYAERKPSEFPPFGKGGSGGIFATY